jgi:hypothetical protein
VRKEFLIAVVCICFAVTLSKTKKKGREHKESLVTSLRKAVDEYSSVYVFSFENMRNTLFKELRDRLKSNSRYICPRYQAEPFNTLTCENLFENNVVGPVQPGYTLDHFGGL